METKEIKKKKGVDNLRNLRDNSQHTNNGRIGVPGERKKGKKTYLKK